MSKANQNNIFIKIAVLINGIPDYKDTALTQREIKEIQANTQQLNFDIEHSHNYLSGITTKQSYISKVDEKIRGKTVPKGSWIMILEITNPTILAGLQNGDIKGVSLETDFTNDVQVKGFTEVIPYKDVETKEEMIPHVISFTGSPANQYPLEIMTHKQYTMKSKKYAQIYGGKDMTDVNADIEEKTWLRGIVDKFVTGQHTMKSTAVEPTQVNQPSMGGNTDELINSLIESQKTIPSLAKSFDAVVESNTRMSEEFNKMNSTLEQVLIRESNTAGQNDNANDKVDGDDQKDDDGKDKDKDTDKNKDQVDDNPDNKDTNTDTDTNTDGQEPDDDALTPEEEETLRKLQEKQARHTRKNMASTPPQLTPPTFTPFNTTEEDMNMQAKQYMANRTFEHFMKGGQ
ncbi:MAG: hypothetical protein BZ136_07420 [Methanosphaera sp. rholeuAM74]|nr:MAG: hypothetical protein BZ136_07420 [Methanosphaera sp. rholeuAM74]